jgi:C-terminal processing protease CtpA/Prc
MFSSKTYCMTFCLLVSLLLPAPRASGKAAANENMGEVSPREIKQLAENLGAKKFAAREAAQKRLEDLVEKNTQAVFDQCSPAYRRTDDPEVRTRLRSVLEKVFEIKVLNMPRGFLGIHMTLINQVDQNGAAYTAIRIMGVVEKTAAAEAGLQANDLILKADDFDVGKNPSLPAFLKYIQSRHPGEIVKMTIVRMDQKQELEVKLGPIPEEMKANLIGDQMTIEKQFEEWLRNLPGGQPGNQKK